MSHFTASLDICFIEGTKNLLSILSHNFAITTWTCHVGYNLQQVFGMTLQESDSRNKTAKFSLASINQIQFSASLNQLICALHLSLITCFQHDGARAELTDAQNHMESTKEKIKMKDTYIMELQEKIGKHQSEASEARKVEQVNQFQINLSHFFSLGSLSSVSLLLWRILSFLDL